MTKRYFHWLAIVKFSLALLSMAVFYLVALQLTGNVHEVLSGELYRSAQMSDAGFARYIKKYHIKTVINLRGENYAQAWYQQERVAAAKENVRYIDFRMSSKRELTEAEVKALVTQMRDAPKPLLIHCRAGADRVGLASALYMAALHRTSEFTAKLQLSPLYGHLTYFIGAPAMNRTFEAMEAWIGYSNS